MSSTFSSLTLYQLLLIDLPQMGKQQRSRNAPVAAAAAEL
jgi:hypothetical protein